MSRGSVSGERRGGRVKGTPNKRTVEIDQVRRKAADQGILPVEVMLDNMRHYFKHGDRANAQKCAADAAPYLHPRLNSINATVDQHTTLTVEDTDNSAWLFAQLDRLAAVEAGANEEDGGHPVGNSGTTH
jgi:hypothetical protein